MSFITSFVMRLGGKYYYTSNHSTLVAFVVGAKFKAGNGFKVIGGHTGMYGIELSFTILICVLLTACSDLHSRLTSFEGQAHK
jgi:hypothetical protein